MSYTKKLIVEPGTKVRLKQFDPAYQGKWGKGDAEQDADKELESVKAKLGELQRKMYGDNRHSLLIVLQGLDAAGKDGVCWHVIGMDPPGLQGPGVQGADRGGGRARLPVAHPPARPGQGRGGGVQSLPL